MDGLPEAVSVMGMADALAKQPDTVEKYLGKAADQSEHSFIAFNTAWFTDGLFVHVPAKLGFRQTDTVAAHCDWH